MRILLTPVNDTFFRQRAQFVCDELKFAEIFSTQHLIQLAA